MNSNSRIARWFLFLQEFDLEIQHVAEKGNEQADALSRAMTDAQERGDQTRRIALIRDATEGMDTSLWIPIIRQAQEQDEELMQTVAQRPETAYEREGLYRVRNEDEATR